jgi:hypothetical protein
VGLRWKSKVGSGGHGPEEASLVGVPGCPLLSSRVASADPDHLFLEELLEPGAGAHACNSSYSGGRDQKDPGSKPARANSSYRPYFEKTITEQVWWCGSRCRPWVQTPEPQ